MRSHGDLAWISCSTRRATQTAGAPRRRVCAVWIANPYGRRFRKRIASGEDIAPDALHLTRTSVTWIQAERRRTARFSRAS